jgi:6-phosphogluconolactonase
MIMKTKSSVRIFETAEAMYAAAAERLIDLAKESVAERGRFVLGLSGGNTPRGLYALLATEPYRRLVLWKSTFVFWSDERCVPSDDERNNAHAARALLLKKIDLPSSHIHPIPVDLLPADAAKTYEETLRAFFGKAAPRFDLLLLGLGTNGHTASLFPCAAALSEKSRWVKEVLVEAQPSDRITLTLPLLNQARSVVFLVAGKEKSGILKTVLTTPGRPDRYPAQGIKPERGEVTWFVDDKAASRLSGASISRLRRSG